MTTKAKNTGPCAAAKGRAGARSENFFAGVDGAMAAESYYGHMAPTKRFQMLAYLDHDRAKLLKELSGEKRLPKTQLIREAVDDLLIKYGKLKKPGKSKR